MSCFIHSQAIAVKPFFFCQHQPEHEAPCQEQWKLGVLHPQKNIGNHCRGINTLSQSGLDVFLVFLAAPSVAAAVSGGLSLRHRESQADSLLAVLCWWWQCWSWSSPPSTPQLTRSRSRFILLFKQSPLLSGCELLMVVKVTSRFLLLTCCYFTTGL